MRYDSKLTIPEDKQIVLNLDSSIIILLRDIGLSDIIPVIASLPGVTIELTDLVYHGELDQTYVCDGVVYALKNRGNGHCIFINGQHSMIAQQCFTDKYARNIPQYGNEISEDLVLQLRDGTAYQEILKPRSGKKIVMVHTPLGQQVNAYNAQHPNAPLDLHDGGELSIVQRENNVSHTDTRQRFIVSNDHTLHPVRQPPHYLREFDDGKVCNLANLYGMLTAFEAHFGDEIRSKLREGKSFDLSVIARDILTIKGVRNREEPILTDVCLKKTHEKSTIKIEQDATGGFVHSPCTKPIVEQVQAAPLFDALDEMKAIITQQREAFKEEEEERKAEKRQKPEVMAFARPAKPGSRVNGTERNGKTANPTHEREGQRSQ